MAKKKEPHKITTDNQANISWVHIQRYNKTIKQYQTIFKGRVEELKPLRKGINKALAKLK